MLILLGFLGELDRILPLPRTDQGFDHPSVPSRLYYEEVPDRSLGSYGGRGDLHFLDSFQQHFCLPTNPRLLDAGTCKLYQPVRDVVVSDCLPTIWRTS